MDNRGKRLIPAHWSRIYRYRGLSTRLPPCCEKAIRMGARQCRLRHWYDYLTTRRMLPRMTSGCRPRTAPHACLFAFLRVVVNATTLATVGRCQSLAHRLLKSLQSWRTCFINANPHDQYATGTTGCRSRVCKLNFHQQLLL
jgi:hypothetical protein